MSGCKCSNPHNLWNLGTGSSNNCVVWKGFVFPVLNNKLINSHFSKSVSNPIFFYFLTSTENLEGNTNSFLENTSPFLPSPHPLINNMSMQRFANSSSRHEAQHLLARRWRDSGRHAGCLPTFRLQIFADKAVNKWADGMGSAGRRVPLTRLQTLSPVHGALG